MKKHTLKWEYDSRIAEIIMKNGGATLAEIVPIYEHVYYKRCNDMVNKCGGRNAGYLFWVEFTARKQLGKIKYPTTSDETGKIKQKRCYGYDKRTKRFVFTDKRIEQQKQMDAAYRSNDYNNKQAKAYSDSVKYDKEELDKINQQRQKEFEYRAWDSANPALFAYPEAVG